MDRRIDEVNDMQKALYYREADEKAGNVQCLLCPHRCVVPPGKTGICRSRKNVSGELYSLTYGQAATVHLDPIEKKPLYHFYPGKKILSLGTTGCNLQCMFCQNWEISQANFGDIPAEKASSAAVLALAREYGSVGIAYTYNEPLVNYEWVRDTARLFRENGLKNVLVSNGYIEPDPWEELLPFVDAANIDVKSFTEAFYGKLCKARLSPVLSSVERMVKKGKHVELTTLLIPGHNDAPAEIERLAGWAAGLSPDIPLHLSRYFPNYKLSFPPTELESLTRAYEIAKQKLNYVYLGNVPGEEYGRTVCPQCRSVLIERRGYATNITGLERNRCANCGREIPVAVEKK